MRNINKLKTLITVSFLFMIVVVSAQKPEYENYKWEENPKRTELSPELLKDDYSTLIDHRIVEFYYDNQGRLLKYFTNHRKVRVNTDDGVDINNKVYIPLDGVIEIMELSARNHKPNGEIVLLGEDKLKEVKGGEEDEGYKIFAFEGVELGSEIEFKYTLKKVAGLTSHMFFYSYYLQKDVSFKLVTPENLVFRTKAYNTDFVTTDTTYDEKNFIYMHADSIPGFKPETYGSTDANKTRIEYAFDLNTLYHTSSYYTYSKATQDIHDFMYVYSSKAKKKLNKLIVKQKFDQLEGEELVKAVDTYIKKNYLVKSIDGIKNGGDIEVVLKNKYSSKLGLVHLYVGILNELGVDFRVVVTKSRDTYPLDKDFMTWTYLEDFLLYFPDFDKFLMPVALGYDLGAIPPSFMAVDALFIKTVQIGDMSTAVHEIKTIPPASHKDSYHNFDIKVSFGESPDECVVNSKQEFAGISGVFLKPYYDFGNDEQKEEILTQVLDGLGQDITILSKSTENDGEENSVFEKPWIINCEYEQAHLIEQAGPNYVCNVGLLIGAQAELYSEEERKLPIDIIFPHHLDRTIAIDIPEGYRVKGLEDLKFDVVYTDDQGDKMAFISDYKVEDNQLKIDISEYYIDILYPVAVYPQFRSVINAAADFNKVSIVFEKI